MNKSQTGAALAAIEAMKIALSPLSHAPSGTPIRLVYPNGNVIGEVAVEHLLTLRSLVNGTPIDAAASYHPARNDKLQ